VAEQDCGQPEHNMTTTLLAVLLSLGGVQAGQPQMARPASNPTPAEVVAALRSSDWVTKGSAARAVAIFPSLQKDAGVKAAVLAELAAEVRVSTDAYAALRRGTFHDTRSSKEAEDEGQAGLALTAAAVKFDGPDVLPALLPTVGYSNLSEDRVATFGVIAIEGLVSLYRSGVGPMYDNLMRFGSLRTLAAITRTNVLLPETRRDLTSIASDAIRDSQTFVAAGGVYLGAALADAELIVQIKAIKAGTVPMPGRSENDRRFLQNVATKALVMADVR
jgi:hypothetical protein